IDYLVVSHTEPDHAGSVEKLLELNPGLKIIATGCAINFLKEIVNGDFTAIAVKDNQEMKIGDKTLRFLAVPNLHWPDTMYTYIEEEQILVTCDSFGSHYGQGEILVSQVKDREGYMRATKYYFDNILGPFKSYMRKAAASALEKLFAGAKEQNISLKGVSAYRSYSRQKEIYNRNVSTKGKKKANQVSAFPGSSEHQTGLTIDVSADSIGCALEQSFGKTIEGKWLASNCYKYGFTIRYPKEKEDITGYSYEPWHIRYVGKNLAKRLYKKKLTLEEYYQTTTVDKKVKPEDQVKDTDTGAPKEPQMTSAPTPNPSYKPKKTPKPSKSPAPTKSAKPKKTKAPKRTHAPKPKKTKKPTVTKAPVKTPAATKAPVPTKAPTKEPTKAPEETKVPSGDEMNE
uniref:D-alanyl-D-alanine carboxypeptidase family protein n=1 Tax=Butyribacter sp. TaxID=2822465 RepID=UPI004027E718